MADVERERTRAYWCLRNAHGNIAIAYAQLDDRDSQVRRRRAIRETLDAVDWLRRALESMDRLVNDYDGDAD